MAFMLSPGPNTTQRHGGNPCSHREAVVSVVEQVLISGKVCRLCRTSVALRQHPGCIDEAVEVFQCQVNCTESLS